MAMPRSKLNMIRARVKVEYEGDDGSRFEMSFDVMPAGSQSAVYLGVEPHFAGMGLWDVEVPRIVDYDLDLQFEKVTYEGLVKTVDPDEVDNP